MAGINFGFNVSQSQLASLLTTTPTVGKISLTSTGPFLGAIGLDAGWQYSALNMAPLETSLGGGKLYLGSSVNSTNYFAATLGASADGNYRLGTGGNQGQLTIGVSAFNNVLTGNTASVIFGAPQLLNAGPQSDALVNGNNANVSLQNVNNYGGGTIFYRGALVTANTAFSLGTGTAYRSTNSTGTTGDNMLRTNNYTLIANNIVIIGDMRVDTQGTGTEFTGTVNLSPGGVAGTHTIENSANNQGGDIAFRGVISGTGNLIKGGSTGTTTLVLDSTANTFTGQVSVTNGSIEIGQNALPNTNGALGNSDTPVLLSGLNGQNIGFLLGGQVTMGRDIYSSPASGQVDAVIANTLYSANLTGNVAVVTSGGTTNFQALANANNGGLIGTLVISGAITGPGNVAFGDTTNTTSPVRQGQVVLLGGANGISPNTYTGTTTLNTGYVVVGGDTYYTGPAANPTIISGPFGTGQLIFGSGGTNNTGVNIGSNGPNRLILNPLGPITTNAPVTYTFDGLGGLDFANTAINFDLNNTAANTLAIRTFQVTDQQGVIEFDQNLTNSSNTTTGGALINKTGSGILVYTGTPTSSAVDQNAADTNYGSLWEISAGTLAVSSDANLGTSAINIPGLTSISRTNAPTDVKLNGGTLAITGAGFASKHDYVFGANSDIDVASGGTFTINTGLLGAFQLTKSGAGTLVLNPSTNNQLTTPTAVTGNADTTLVIGGSNPFTSAGGNQANAVVTTNTSGNPFVASNGTVTLNGGLLGVTNTSNTGATINLGATSTLNFNAGSYVQVKAPSSGVNTLSVGTLTEGLDGVLIILADNASTFGTPTGNQLFEVSGTAPGGLQRDPHDARCLHPQCRHQ